MTLAPPCFNIGTAPMDLNRLQTLPVEAKAIYSKMIIQRFYIQERGKVYVAYSGGKDSTVLLHLVRSLYPEVPAVICKARRGAPSALKLLDTPTSEFRYGKAHYRHLLDAPFKISSKCCDRLKKAPFRTYETESGRAGIIGTKAEDSHLRATVQMKEGEIRGHKCAPLGIWTDEDIWEYIRIHGLNYCHVYDMGYKATGCVFCMFGIMFDRHRFLKLKATHPRLWEYCMRSWDEGGLGMREVCDYIGIPTGCCQSSLNEFERKEVFE